MKSVRRLSRFHSYQLALTLAGILALAGLLLKAWTAVIAVIITLALGIILGLIIDRIADPGAMSRRNLKTSSKRGAQAGKYIPKDRSAKGKSPRQTDSSLSPAAKFLRNMLQWSASLPGQLLSLFVVTSLAFFVFIQMGGKSNLSGSTVNSQDAFFCGASIVGVTADQVDIAKLGEYEYALEADSCRDFEDYVRELTPGSGSSEDEMRLEICNMAQEAMMSEMRRIQHFDEIQFLITGDPDSLRAYNMDNFTKNCANP
ncbi:MAG TPA: hypothetical protein VLM80_05680 [Anaerolineales bacterium]|nr:hypothetical protein [Anaerolineales bacterium]